MEKLKTAGIALGIVYLIYRFAPGGDAVKAATLGVMGVIVGNQLPYVGTALKG